jgi:DNA-directed RNA polymerase
MPVFNHAYEPKCKRITIHLNGQRRKIKLAIGDKKISKKKAKQAAAANFIHSLDAGHLQELARVAKLEGIQMVPVHDSYACLAPRATRFKEIIGDAFNTLHEPGIALINVLLSAKSDLPPPLTLPRLPEWGSLDIITLIKNKIYQRPRLGCVCAGSAMFHSPVPCPLLQIARALWRQLARLSRRRQGKRVAADEFYVSAAL